jgi:Protein of unknown function (DUF1566)/Repeat of unknown function (DUF5648)
VPSILDLNMKATSPKALVSLCALSLLLLTACGGSERADTHNVVRTQGTPSESSAQPPVSEADVELQQRGARLNTQELERIAKTGVLPKAFEGPSLSGDSADQRFGADKTSKDAKTSNATKSAGLAGPTPKYATTKAAAYRFYNTLTSAHFYTTSEAERDHVRNTLRHMNYEGPAFSASRSTVPGLSPVHRFYNGSTGVHFYTISEEERAHVEAKLPQFKYEGVAYHASTLPGTGYTPLFRFFLGNKGYHFYTNSEEERDRIIATLPQYSYEGIGYYVLGDEWQTPAVPHTGVDRSQCYRNSSNFLAACDNPESMDLSPKQDGHLRDMFPMAYEAVGGGECQRDKVTGLVWEEKASGGLRGMNNVYTNHGDKRAGDASDYVDRVNEIGLCGFTDWRLPSVEELRGLMHFGVNTSPLIDTNAFPNTAAGDYWTSTGYVLEANQAWIVKFNQFNNDVYGSPINKATPIHVRLVRGAPWTGKRYLVTTVAYSNSGLIDAANNAVTDRKTGLTWRRCLEGQIWIGSNCEGTFKFYTHEEVLLSTKSPSLFWRVPNIKELQTLVDNSRIYPSLDEDAFFGGGFDVVWSSTPSVASPGKALVSNFSRGETYIRTREQQQFVRLVVHRLL